MKMKELDAFSVGMTAQRQAHITRETVQAYADLSGDYNPIHLDEAYAKRTRFQGCIAHGGIGTALISNILGNDLPGPGCVFLREEIKYRNPIRIGDTLTGSATILEIMPEKRRILLETRVDNQSGEILLEGAALMMLLQEETT